MVDLILEAIDAKEKLWAYYGPEHIGDSHKITGSSCRTEKQAHILDILNAFETLDTSKNLPIIAINAFLSR